MYSSGKCAFSGAWRKIEQVHISDSVFHKHVTYLCLMSVVYVCKPNRNLYEFKENVKQFK